MSIYGLPYGEWVKQRKKKEKKRYLSKIISKKRKSIFSNKKKVCLAIAKLEFEFKIFKIHDFYFL